MIPYVRKSYADIFEDFYNITNGAIILGGSLSLKMQNVISRDINDLDLAINKSDWDLYEHKIIFKYKVYYGQLVELHPNMEHRVCTCFNKENKNEFHLFINNIENDMFNTIFYNNIPIRVFKPELHLLDKEYMLADDVTNMKNVSDVDSIKKYLNAK
jgi:hypothetical protein